MRARCYDTDLNDDAWAWIAPYLLAAGRVDGHARPTSAPSLTLFYLLGTGCQWRLLPREFPRPGTVYHYFRAWKDAGVLAEQQGALHEQARLSRSCLPCPSVVILDSQSVKTAERGGIRGFDGHKQVKGRKRIVRIEYALCRLWAVNPGIAVVVPLIGLQDGDRSISSIVGDISPVIA
jgi:putative transposase